MRSASGRSGRTGTDDRLQHALDLAYGYLNQRYRTVSELRRHLDQKGLETEMVEGAVGTLVDQGYLDDARFARLFAADKRELEQWGSDRIRRGLLSRGVDRDLVDATLYEEAPDGEPRETELVRALELLRRRFPSPPRDRRDRDRALGVLLRKGYDTDVALDALLTYARED